MNAPALLTEIEQAGGKIWAEGDKLKFQRIPARLIPAIRAQKPELLQFLSSQPLASLPSIQLSCEQSSSMVQRDRNRKCLPDPNATLEWTTTQSDGGLQKDPRPDRISDRAPKLGDLIVMAETLLVTMRQIGLRVRLTPQGELRIGPSDMLWPYDRTLIQELKPQLVTLLKQEVTQSVPTSIT